MIEQEISWTCEDCGKKHVRAVEASKEKGLTLPLAEAGQEADGKRYLSVLGLLDKFCEEDLEIRCESDTCAASQQLEYDQGSDEDITSKERLLIRTISRGPEILCINMRRSHQEWTTVPPREYKLCNNVDFPEDLNLSQWTVDGKPLRYRLFGVAAHSGKSVDSGHWIAAVRHSNGQNYRTVNDSAVEREEPQTFEELRYPYSRGQDYDPTLLVYVKVAEW